MACHAFLGGHAEATGGDDVFGPRGRRRYYSPESEIEGMVPSLGNLLLMVLNVPPLEAPKPRSPADEPDAQKLRIPIFQVLRQPRAAASP
jgi:hypothetical protein